MVIRKPPLYLVDASIYIFRHYFTLPQRWYSGEGYPTQAVYGYLGFLLGMLEQVQPQFMAVAFDESLGQCFRNTIYPDYKANRELPDDALAFQLQACAEVTAILGILTLASDSHEADDIIGTLAERGRDDGHPIAVISGDKDLAQLLLDDDTLLWDFDRTPARDRFAIKRELGVWPEQLADYLALVGDRVDNIPGLPGVGAKTAIELLAHCASLNGLLAAGSDIANLPVRGAKQLPEKIAAHRQQLLMAQSLTRIALDAPVGEPALQRAPIALDKLDDFCQRMGLGTTLKNRAVKLAHARDQTQHIVKEASHTR